MNRRVWLKGTAALAAAAGLSNKLAEAAQANTPAKAPAGREYYLLRRYTLNNGVQRKGTSSYFQDALVPALTRMGMGPVGAFTLSYGSETPMSMLLIPSTDCMGLCMLDLHLAQDTAFMKAAEPFWSSPANAPLFERVESQLSIAFEGYPKLTPPSTTEKRILQLRTYESPTLAAHVRKVEMFHQGEFRIFKETGSTDVFFSDNLVGPRLPSLTYMLAHKDLATLDQDWKGFSANPDWKKLSSDPRYAGDPIVSRIDNLLFDPMPFSQI